MILNLRNSVPIFCCRNKFAVVVDFYFLGKFFGIIYLVVLFVIKAYGKSLVTFKTSSNIA